MQGVVKLFRNLFNIWRPSPDFVSFDTQLKWLVASDEFQDHRKCISFHHSMGCSSTLDYIYFDQYLFNLYKFHGYSHTAKYFNNNNFTLKIFLIDDTFKIPELDDHFSIYNDSFCYPEIYNGNGVVKDGPWITKLKQHMNNIGVKQSYLNNKSIVNEKEAVIERKQQQQIQCCNSKRENVLKNFK